MPALTIKNIPEDLYNRLKEAARTHRRSLNSEVLYCIERILRPHKIAVSDHLDAARRSREKTVAFKLTDRLLDAAKNAVRP
jgi:plasmid stability protein